MAPGSFPSHPLNPKTYRFLDNMQQLYYSKQSVVRGNTSKAMRTDVIMNEK